MAKPAAADGMMITTAPYSTRASAWSGAGEAALVTALARRLPHFGTMSYVQFDNTGGTVLNRGQRPVLPISTRMEPSADQPIDQPPEDGQPVGGAVLEPPAAIILPTGEQACASRTL
ncbi:MAG: hypothetical protein GKR94_08850 [Gammaproteobacteria bacterium]|nr:hypothetical protein [Gammaproteobacteria bacterium]